MMKKTYEPNTPHKVVTHGRLIKDDEDDNGDNDDV